MAPTEMKGQGKGSVGLLCAVPGLKGLPLVPHAEVGEPVCSKADAPCT